MIATLSLLSWWLSVIWTLSMSFFRPFDDWKNGVFYVGAAALMMVTDWSHWKMVDIGVDRLRIIKNLLALYFFVCLTSLFFGNAPGEGILELSRLTLWMGLVFALTKLGDKRLILLGKATVISAATIATITQLGLSGHQVWPSIGQLLPPIGHVSYYGNFMASALIISVYLIMSVNSRLRSSFWVFCSFQIVCGLWLSGTRASLVGFISAAFLIITIFVFQKKWARLGLCVFSVSLVLFFASYTQTSGVRDNPWERLKLFSLKNDFSSGRVTDSIPVLEMVKEHPKGFGLGSFRFVYPGYAYRGDNKGSGGADRWQYHPHNEILHQAVEVGILGTIIFLAIIAAIYFHGFKNASFDLVLLGMAGFTASFVNWQFDTSYLFPVSRMMTAYFIALILKDRTGNQILVYRSWLKSAVIAFIAVPSLISYQFSLFALQKSQTDKENISIWSSVADAFGWGAFDTTFNQAVILLQAGKINEASEISEDLYRYYSEVPVVLYLKGVLSVYLGKADEAVKFLKHSIDNDPEYNTAKDLLETLLKAKK